MKSTNEFQGFWGSVARKAKAVLDDEVPPEQLETPKTARQREYKFDRGQQDGRQFEAAQNRKKPDKAVLRKGFGAIASSFNYIGNALEEGLNKVENRTADIIQDSRNRKSHVRNQAAPDTNQRPSYSGHVTEPSGTQNQTSPAIQTDMDIQLQASRDVAMAMAAKTKVLLRELKTVKSDLAFAKERCAQLEEENRILRESMENGDNPEDDELIRLQLESLLAEKARLAQENAFYTRENRFLREVVEYHQLTMQDVVYLNERNEEISEVYPGKVPDGTNLNTVATMPSLSPSVHASELVFNKNMNSK
ncbi:Autophagy-related protein 16 [Bienertia sinuspersici]